MKTLKSILILALPVLLFSCGPQVKTVKADDANLEQYDSFAYLPNTNIDVANKSYDTGAVNQMVIESIKENLEKEGYYMDKDSPDLLVLISAKTNLETETTTDPVYAAYPYSATMTTVQPYYSSYYFNDYMNYSNVVGYDTDTNKYKEGTVIIDIIDRETKETVWKGISSEAIGSQTKTGAIKDLINEIFTEYPLS
ncbi:MAG: DUF4136 domain-containing protein [Leeuwenhoekiella sp.]